MRHPNHTPDEACRSPPPTLGWLTTGPAQSARDWKGELESRSRDLEGLTLFYSPHDVSLQSPH
jgi:hypothetical protein